MSKRIFRCKKKKEYCRFALEHQFPVTCSQTEKECNAYRFKKELLRLSDEPTVVNDQWKYNKGVYIFDRPKQTRPR